MVKKYVLDTSVVIEKIASDLIKKKELKGKIIIPHVVVAELESQANKGLEIGFLGLEEIQEIRSLCEKGKLELEFYGSRPTEQQIKFAKSGEIDAVIRQVAVDEEATLITADKVQAESGKAFGLDVKYYKFERVKEKLTIESLFDSKTMSLHLKEKNYAYAKKGKPGEWSLEKVGKKIYSKEDMEEIAKEIVEKSRIDSEAFVEISRKGSSVIQYKDYRIVIVRKPVADGLEITVVKPLKKLEIEEYKLPEKLNERIAAGSRGIIISGEPGSGKSTFATALADYFVKMKKVVKTVESPRDLKLREEVTQYSKNYTTSEEIHDILFLSRADNIIFDEMRDTPDFNLYMDLRLAGSECIGVVHSSSPIDAVQRFITRMEVGMIPSVIDTIIFIDKGKIGKIFVLKMSVKVPSGMMEADLARPVVEVFDFENGKLEFEIYSYGEQTVVIPVVEGVKSGLEKLAEKQIEREMQRYSDNIKAEILNPGRVAVYVDAHEIPNLIGAGGKNIMKVEKELGMGIEVREISKTQIKKEGKVLEYSIKDSNKTLVFFVKGSGSVDVFVDDNLLFTGIIGKKGIMKLHKKSKLGKSLADALDAGKKVEFRKV